MNKYKLERVSDNFCTIGVISIALCIIGIIVESDSLQLNFLILSFFSIFISIILHLISFYKKE